LDLSEKDNGRTDEDGINDAIGYWKTKHGLFPSIRLPNLELLVLLLENELLSTDQMHSKHTQHPSNQVQMTFEEPSIASSFHPWDQ
jgi:hypothetical protein